MLKQKISIPRSTSTKLLCAKLTFFKELNNSLVGKLSYANYAFIKIRELSKIYIAQPFIRLVYPYLLNCLSVLDCASEYLLQSQITMQKKITRILLSGSKNYYEHIANFSKAYQH